MLLTCFIMLVSCLESKFSTGKHIDQLHDFNSRKGMSVGEENSTYIKILNSGSRDNKTVQIFILGDWGVFYVGELCLIVLRGYSWLSARFDPWQFSEHHI